MANKPEEQIAKLIFEAENKKLVEALEQNAKKTEEFNSKTEATLKHFGEYEKKSKPAIKSMDDIGASIKKAYEGLEGYADLSQTSYKKITGAMQGASKTAEILDNSMLRLGARLLGVGTQYDMLAEAVGPAADVFDEFAGAGSAAEKAFVALDMAEKPVQSGLGGTAKAAGTLAERFELMGDRGTAASKVMGGMALSLSGLSRSIGAADLIGDVYRGFTGLKEAFPSIQEGIESALGPLKMIGDQLFGPIIEKMKTWEGRLELLGQASQKLQDNQGKVVLTLTQAILKAGQFVATAKQFTTVASTIKAMNQELSHVNEGLGVIQSMGIDTSIAQFAIGLTDLSNNFITNAEKAQEFFNVTIAGYAKLEDQLATVNTLSAGQAVGIDAMGRSMQDLVNGPLKNQVTSVEATNALYNTMSSGMTDIGDAQRFMTAGLKLSSATGADAAQTIEVLAKTQKAYGLSASEAATTAAKLNGVVEAGITTFPQLVGGLSRTASVARASGVGLDEMLGSIAALTQTMTTDDSLTGYASLLQAVASQGEQSASAVSELGVRFDVNRIKAVGLQTALGDLYKASGGNVETLKKIIPDSLAFQTALQLMTTASKDAATNLDNIGNTGAESLDALFDARRESAMQRVSSLMKGFNEIAIDLGKRVLPMLEGPIGFLQNLLDVFQSLPEPVKNVAAGLAMFGLGARSAGSAIGDLIGGLAGLIKNFLTARAISLLFRGELVSEIKIMREMITVNGDYAGALLRLFGVQGQLATRIKSVSGITRMQIQLQDLAAAAADKYRIAIGLMSGATETARSVGESFAGAVHRVTENLSDFSSRGATFANALSDIMRDSELTVRERSDRIADAVDSMLQLDPENGRAEMRRYLSELMADPEFVAQAQREAMQRLMDMLTPDADAEGIAGAFGQMLSGIGERTEGLRNRFDEIGGQLEQSGAPEAVRKVWARISGASMRGAEEAEEAIAQLELNLGEVASPSLRQKIEQRLDTLRAAMQGGLLSAFDPAAVVSSRLRMEQEIEQLQLDLEGIGDTGFSGRIKQQLDSFTGAFDRAVTETRAHVQEMEQNLSFEGVRDRAVREASALADQVTAEIDRISEATGQVAREAQYKFREAFDPRVPTAEAREAMRQLDDAWAGGLDIPPPDFAAWENVDNRFEELADPWESTLERIERKAKTSFDSVTKAAADAAKVVRDKADDMFSQPASKQTIDVQAVDLGSSSGEITGSADEISSALQVARVEISDEFEKLEAAIARGGASAQKALRSEFDMSDRIIDVVPISSEIIDPLKEDLEKGRQAISDAWDDIIERGDRFVERTQNQMREAFDPRIASAEIRQNMREMEDVWAQPDTGVGEVDFSREGLTEDRFSTIADPWESDLSRAETVIRESATRIADRVTEMVPEQAREAVSERLGALQEEVRSRMAGLAPNIEAEIEQARMALYAVIPADLHSQVGARLDQLTAEMRHRLSEATDPAILDQARAELATAIARMNAELMEFSAEDTRDAIAYHLERLHYDVQRQISSTATSIQSRAEEFRTAGEQMGREFADGVQSRVEEGQERIRNGVQGVLGNALSAVGVDIGAIQDLGDLMEGLRQTDFGSTISGGIDAVSQRGTRAMEQLRNSVVETTLSFRGLANLPLIGNKVQDFSVLENLMKSATGESLKLTNNLKGTERQLAGLREFAKEILPSLANSPLKAQLQEQAEALDNFFEQRINSIRESEARVGRERLKQAQIDAKAQLAQEQANLKAVQSVRAQADLAVGLSDKERTALKEQATSLEEKTKAQIESLEVAIREGDLLEETVKKRFQQLEVFERERAAIEAKIKTKEDEQKLLASEIDVKDQQRADAEAFTEATEAEIAAIKEKIAAKREEIGVGDTIVLGGEQSEEEVARAQQVQAEIEGLKEVLAAKLEEVAASEETSASLTEEINSRMEEIDGINQSIESHRKAAEERRRGAQSIREMDASQQLSNRAMETSTAVANANNDARSRMGATNNKLVEIFNKVTNFFGLNTRAQLENTIGTDNATRSQLTLAGALRIAAGGLQGLNLQIIQNKIQQINWNKLLDLNAWKLKAQAAWSKIAAIATLDIGAAAAGSLIAVGALWTALGPIAVIGAAISAAFAIASESFGWMGGAAKSSIELKEGLTKLKGASDDLREASRAAADGQEELNVRTEKYNSIFAKTTAALLKSVGFLMSPFIALGRVLISPFDAVEVQTKRLENELAQRKEALLTATEEERELLTNQIKEIQADLASTPQSFEAGWKNGAQNAAERVDMFMDDIRGVTKEFDDTMLVLNQQAQDRLKVKADLLAGDATTEKGKAILEKASKERRSLTAEEQKELTELESDGSKERLKGLESQIAATEELIEKAWNEGGRRELERRKAELQAEAEFETEKAKLQQNYLAQQAVLASRKDNAAAATGLDKFADRAKALKGDMATVIEGEGLDPGKAVAKFDEIAEAVNTTSEGQRRAATTLLSSASGYLDNLANLKDTALDVNQIDADIEKYISAIDAAVEAGALSKGKAVDFYKEILEAQGELLSPEARADLQKRVIDAIPEDAERAIRPIQELIAEVNHQVSMGDKDRVEGAKEVYQSEQQITQKRLQAQVQYVAELRALHGDDSQIVKDAQRGLVELERTSQIQSIESRKKLLDTWFNEQQVLQNRANSLLSLSEKDRFIELDRMVKEGVLSEENADALRVSNTKERVKIQIGLEQQRIDVLRSELAASKGDGDRRREIEQQLFAALKNKSDLIIQAIEAEVAVRERATEKAVLGIELTVDAIDREVAAIENRNRLLEAANQLQQTNDQVDNFGIESEVALIERAIGLQGTLNNLRSQPEYYQQAQALLEATGKAGRTDLQLLDEKQAKERELGEQKYEQMLVQQEFEMDQLKAQMELEKLRARAAIQEAEIASLKALQAKFAAESAVAAAIESGDEDRLAAAELQVELAERGIQQSETQIDQAKENLGIVEQITKKQVESLEKQQKLQREQSKQEQQALLMQQQIEYLERMAALEQKILDLRNQSSEAQIALAESTIGLNESLKNFADIPGYLDEAIAILEQGEGFEESTIALLDKQSEAIQSQKALLEERTKNIEATQRLESEALERALVDESRQDVAQAQRQELQLRHEQEVMQLRQERNNLARAELDLLNRRAEIERSIIDLQKQASEARISLTDSMIGLNESLKNFADIPGYLDEAIAILAQGEGFEESTLALLDQQREAIDRQKTLLKERAENIEAAQKLESEALERALANESQQDIAQARRQELQLRHEQATMQLQQELNGLVQAELDLLSRRADIERSIVELDNTSLGNVTRMMDAMQSMNDLKRKQRDLEQQIVDSETQALQLLAEMEPNPRKRKAIEESIAQTKLNSLQRAQEIQRNELEMTLQREEIELRIAAIKNQAEQARAAAGVQTAQANLDRVQASGASELEVRAAQAGLQAAMTEAIAAGIEGAGIQEQMSIFDEYAETSREQLAVSQRMEDFAARGELANSRASFNQGRRERYELERDIRSFYADRTGVGVGRDEGAFFSELRAQNRQGGRGVGQLGLTDGERGSRDLMDSITSGFKAGGEDFASTLDQFSDRFLAGLDDFSMNLSPLGLSPVQAPSIGKGSVAPTLAPPRIEQPRETTQRNQRESPPTMIDSGFHVQQLTLDNKIEITMNGTAEDMTGEVSDKIKQAVLNSFYDVSVELRRMK